MKLEEIFKKTVSHDKKIELFSAFFVVRSSCQKASWHTDYVPQVGTDALTLITPLKDYNTSKDFSFIYKPTVKNDSKIPDNDTGIPDIRRYEYRKGKAIVFGSRFEHSTEPGVRPGVPQAYLCFVFGSDKAKIWEHIQSTTAAQSRFIIDYDGKPRETEIASKCKQASSTCLRAGKTEPRCGERFRKELIWWFRDKDANRNGLLEKKEVVSNDEDTHYFQAADTNHDGKLEFREVCGFEEIQSGKRATMIMRNT